MNISPPNGAAKATRLHEGTQVQRVRLTRKHVVISGRVTHHTPSTTGSSATTTKRRGLLSSLAIGRQSGQGCQIMRKCVLTAETVELVVSAHVLLYADSEGNTYDARPHSEDVRTCIPSATLHIRMGSIPPPHLLMFPPGQRYLLLLLLSLPSPASGDSRLGAPCGQATLRTRLAAREVKSGGDVTDKWRIFRSLETQVSSFCKGLGIFT